MSSSLCLYFSSRLFSRKYLNINTFTTLRNLKNERLTSSDLISRSTARFSSSVAQNYDLQYPGHIKLTNVQRTLLTIGSAAMCLYNPKRDDMISTFGETTGHYALKKIKSKMLQDPEGCLVLKEKPIINTENIDYEYLNNLPDGTLGKEYWRFLNYNGFDPDGRRPVHFVDDPDLVYIMLRYRQTHDLIHALLGMPPHMLGEVVVKWIEALQTGLPMCITAAVFGPLRLGPKHSQLYWSEFMPWAIRCGRNSKFLLSVYFEKYWEENVVDLRQKLNIEPPPKNLFMKDKRSLPGDDSISE
ncbi:ubiquinone biosynthesis protein COQ4 homolog, mitochondrial isoform X1 [Octopus bimaculoides]|uniref:Ubiquinone biosynthesis protein COQ4 homolog, mitochondrial n=1 Tax=Octopus bimaculoides TaxID=37653 RepID=A0A0L8FQS9_OCTBM|nr:ubiquinone biosynthesis protein COQ4 homolog, mitochondrial isoform X1 [Octopus bimaculoides]|eukprot:XP_014787763.1 PREDICTED: ubiquinone biosynthesis protein COQ4 homolog, mitochondrial-like isoform X2 [Octopus bimaculoides]